eukprot:444384-Pleurochrysis_carterae.AAC.1
MAILASIRHPNIVAVREVVVDSSQVLWPPKSQRKLTHFSPSLMEDLTTSACCVADERAARESCARETRC